MYTWLYMQRNVCFKQCLTEFREKEKSLHGEMGSYRKTDTKLITKFTLDKVVSAIHLARTDVYHTNANHAHEELRELMKIGKYLDNAEIVTHLNHTNVFESEIARIKVKCFLYC